VSRKVPWSETVDLIVELDYKLAALLHALEVPVPPEPEE
jgi:hypothetical protein